MLKIGIFSTLAVLASAQQQTDDPEDNVHVIQVKESEFKDAVLESAEIIYEYQMDNLSDRIQLVEDLMMLACMEEHESNG